MSTIGMNHFILEKDEPGFYWYLIDLIETLEGLEERQDYVLGTLHGITYILLNVFETEDGLCKSAVCGKYLLTVMLPWNEIYNKDCTVIVTLFIGNIIVYNISLFFHIA